MKAIVTLGKQPPIPPTVEGEFLGVTRAGRESSDRMMRGSACSTLFPFTNSRPLVCLDQSVTTAPQGGVPDESPWSDALGVVG